MAEGRKDTDIEKLLAEVEGTLAGKPAPPQVGAGTSRREGGLVARVRAAFLTGAVAGALVWVLFALLPFLRATSGAVGAFLATVLAVLVLRRR